MASSLRRAMDTALPVELELIKEKTAALRRVGWKLEQLLAQLAEVAGRFDDAPLAARAELAREHARVRAEAQKHRWYLIVQREAMGMTQHADVDATYRIPPPLR